MRTTLKGGGITSYLWGERVRCNLAEKSTRETATPPARDGEKKSLTLYWGKKRNLSDCEESFYHRRGSHQLPKSKKRKDRHPHEKNFHNCVNRSQGEGAIVSLFLGKGGSREKVEHNLPRWSGGSGELPRLPCSGGTGWRRVSDGGGKKNLVDVTSGGEGL